MAVAQRMSEEAYSDLVFARRAWALELYKGRLRDKPAMTWDENGIQTSLAFLLMDQLDRRQFHVFTFLRVRLSPDTLLVPDVMVVPSGLGESFRDKADVLAIFDDPLPLVADVICSLGDYDAEGKVTDYQRRGDLEIWRIHPYERTLTAWRRQLDGTYTESVYRTGVVKPVALPGVEITLDELFDV